MVLLAAVFALAFTSPQRAIVRRATLPVPPLIVAAPPPSTPPPVKGAGYGIRPSAAIERGGGFYVPGLEGYRLRLLVAVVLGGALVLNRVLSPGEPVASQAFSEVLGATGSALLIWQVLAEEEAERERESVARRAAVVARLEELSEVSSDLAAVPAARGRWAASALLRLTPACAVLWAGGEDSVLLRYGRFDEPSLGEGRQPTALLRRLGSETAVAIDDVGDAVPELLPTASASVVLERCGSGLLAVVSERPGAFTSKHRTWIGWMARLLAED